MTWILYRSFWTKWNFKPAWGFHVNKILPETKWIRRDLLNIVFNAHVRLKLIAGMDFISVTLNFISGDKISCKHYPKWNTYACTSKDRVVLKCSRNETSCQQTCFYDGLKSQTGMSSFHLSWEGTLNHNI